MNNAGSIVTDQLYNSIAHFASVVSPNIKDPESPIVCLWSKRTSYWLFTEKKIQAYQSLNIWKNILCIFSKLINIEISLPVMGSAGIFSTSGVLDSAGNAKVSFLAKKSEKNNLSHFLIIVSKYNSLKTTNRLFQDYSAHIPSHQAVNTITVNFYQWLVLVVTVFRIPSH